MLLLLFSTFIQSFSAPVLTDGSPLAEIGVGALEMVLYLGSDFLALSGGRILYHEAATGYQQDGLRCTL